MLNVYAPQFTIIKSIVSENDVNDIKTFELQFNNESDLISFDYIPGQFAELSIIGKGECPIGIASSPTEKGSIKFTIKKMGEVTTAFHNHEVGDVVGIRGPLGNGWPIEEMKGKNIVIIGGGFAFSTLRSLTEFILDKDNRDKYGNLTVIYGNRNSSEVLYREDLKRWEKRDDLEVILTIDQPEDHWTKKVGYVAPIVKEVNPSPKDAYAVVCGPPIMIKTTINVLKELKFKDEFILNSLEMRMKCGVGKCGRCNIGDKYVCVDGPVFSLAELNEMPDEY
ncbi:MAG: FAD/NAD(P)-binding protein [Candidatus Lokiarchaeota archaeon]